LDIVAEMAFDLKERKKQEKSEKRTTFKSEPISDIVALPRCGLRPHIVREADDQTIKSGPTLTLSVFILGGFQKTRLEPFLRFLDFALYYDIKYDVFIVPLSISGLKISHFSMELEKNGESLDKEHERTRRSLEDAKKIIKFNQSFHMICIYLNNRCIFFIF
jgi:hypothetical protein